MARIVNVRGACFVCSCVHIWKRGYSLGRITDWLPDSFIVVLFKLFLLVGWILHNTGECILGQ